MVLKSLSDQILEEMGIGKTEYNEFINTYASVNSDSAFNLKRAFKNMGDQSFTKFVGGVLPIQSYKLTLEVVRDGVTYTTSIGDNTEKTREYVKLGNTICLKQQVEDGIHLVDVNTPEYLEIIGAY